MSALWIASALAVPAVEGWPEDVATVQVTWDAAEACAGWAPEASTVVVDRQLKVPNPEPAVWVGDALTLQVRWDRSSYSVAESVAWAFVGGDGVGALARRAEPLMLCIASKVDRLVYQPRVLRIDPIDTLVGWNEERPRRMSKLGEYGDYSLASRRFWLAAAELLSPTVLYKKDLSWDEVRSALDTERGQPLLALLEAEPKDAKAFSKALTEALSDQDEDGLAKVHEELIDLDPVQYDSDGDQQGDGDALFDHLVPVSFSGPEGEVRLAPVIWRGAEVCAAREAEFDGTITIEYAENLLADWLTSTDVPNGTVNVDRSGTAMAYGHSLTRFWYAGGAGLVEGRAALLAECADEVTDFTGYTLPQHLPFEGDLKTFSREDDDETGGVSQSFRFWRAAAAVLGRDAVIRSTWSTWEEVDAALRAAGERGVALADVLQSGPAEQSRWLADRDLDGLTAIEEQWSGTDPERWDSDGDGFWDGAGRTPETALPLAKDGTIVCLSRRPPNKGRHYAVYGGLLYGDSRGTAWAGSTKQRHDWTNLGALAMERAGGQWIDAAGYGLKENDLCAWSPTGTIWVDDRDVEGVEGAIVALRDALASAEARFTALHGPPAMRWQISVTETPTATSRANKTFIVMLNDAQLKKAYRGKQLDELALVLTAMQRLPWSEGSPQLQNNKAAQAWAASVNDGKIPNFFELPKKDLKPYEQAAERCEAGWNGLLSGECSLNGNAL